MSIDDLVAESDLIVLGRVEEVQTPRSGQRVAQVRVLEFWKGTGARRLEVLASPIWTCDVSTAEAHETSVFFLQKHGRSKVLRIAHAGNGRMPIRRVEGVKHAKILQPTLYFTEHQPRAGESYPSTIPLEDLKRRVQASRGRPPN
jgi:hypothetical protein